VSSEIDWDDRELCPDGACTGVLSTDGVCPVCGKTGSATRPARASKAEPASPAAPPVEARPAPARSAGEDDIDDRELCPDGACIGVIGEDGACKVCGKRAS
jgi:hypothetical protein